MIYTDLYNTIGGVVVNGNMEVTNEQGEAIPGLYAGGEMACVTVMDPPHSRRVITFSGDFTAAELLVSARAQSR